MLHSNVEPDSVEENSNVGEVSSLDAGGPLSIVVCGGVVLHDDGAGRRRCRPATGIRRDDIDDVGAVAQGRGVEGRVVDGAGGVVGITRSGVGHGRDRRSAKAEDSGRDPPCVGGGGAEPAEPMSVERFAGAVSEAVGETVSSVS